MKANSEVCEARTEAQNLFFSAENIVHLQNSDGSEFMLRKGVLI